MNSRANIVVGIVVAVVLVAAIGSYAALQQSGQGATRLWAVVHDGDGKSLTMPLSQNQERIVTTSLGTNVIVVENGAVFVRTADCDNQDCVHQGKLDAPGRQIICLPHKLWVEVVADGDAGSSDMDVNAVAAGDDSAEAGSLDAVAR